MAERGEGVAVGEQGYFWRARGAAALFGVALLLLVAAGLALRVRDPGFDRAILLAMRLPGDPAAAIGPAWLKRAMLAVTMLGNPQALVPAAGIAVVALAVRRQWQTAALVLAGTISGPTVVALAKHGFARPRPELVEHLVQVTNASFPSGHAANSAVVYLTLALLLTRVVRRRARVAIVAGAAMLVVAIGCSRVFLGVHWPSDVVAGWAFGALWAAGWWELGRAWAPPAASNAEEL